MLCLSVDTSTEEHLVDRVMSFTSKERLLRAIAQREVDRPPVIVPGGMMAGTLAAIIEEADLSCPDIHTETASMVEYARTLRARCSIDNLGVPFCMTVEAEDFGASVDLGSPLTEPRVTRYAAETLDELGALTPTPCGRHRTVLEAIEQISGGAAPVVGNLTGPISLVTSLIEPTTFYRAMVKQADKAAAVMELVTDHIIAFAMEQIDAGADVIVIADPSSAGDIMGGWFFDRTVAPSLKKIVHAVKGRGVPAILHICGDILPLVDYLHQIAWDALSVDSIVSLRRLRGSIPERALMGNVSTHMLATAEPEKIYRAAMQAGQTASILAPACGLPTTTWPDNIRDMVQAASDKGMHRNQPR
jgi:MtaA/CmuA family methyltransferase